MAKDANVEYATTGHQDILASLTKKYRLNLVQTFSSDNTVCSLATMRTEEQVFVKVKGYKKNRVNEGKFRRAVVSNRMAGKMKNNIMPRVLEFKAFEREDVLWLVSLSTYGGEPMSRGLFYDGDGANVADHTLEQIRHALKVIPETPSISTFYDPRKISEFIRKEFGEDVVFAASEWTSAHCDFHWGNILAEGKHVIDWDMFSLAPKGFDAASIALFSVSDMRLFERVHRGLEDILSNDSARVASLFAAARILRLMETKAYASMRVYEANLRTAVNILTQGEIR